MADDGNYELRITNYELHHHVSRFTFQRSSVVRRPWELVGCVGEELACESAGIGWDGLHGAVCGALFV